MPCLCAPTTHAGSFRCRLHRSNSWCGRSMPKPRTSGSDLEVCTASLIEDSLLQKDQRPVPLPPVSSSSSFSRSPKARSPPTGGSRLRNVVSSSDDEDEAPQPSLPITERVANMKMATGTGGSFSSAPGGELPCSGCSKRVNLLPISSNNPTEGVFFVFLMYDILLASAFL